MKFKNLVIFLTLSLLIFGCSDLKNRYDPVEASRNIFQMKEFVFYSSENSPPLVIDAWGEIDNDDYTITVPYPPSEDLSAINLTAKYVFENIGIDGGDDHHMPPDNRIWAGNPTIKFSPEEFKYKEEPLYEPEYKVIMEPLFDVNLRYDTPKHFNATSFFFYMDFNDDAGPDSALPNLGLGSGAFIDGFGSGSINNFTSLAAGDFTPALPAGGNSYRVEVHIDQPGPITIQFAAGSVIETISKQVNQESNILIYIYDNEFPTTGAISSIGSLNNSTPIPVNEAVLSISFPQASDMYTPDNELFYEVYTSNTSGSLTNLLTISTGFPTDLVFTYDEMDSGTRTLLTTGNLLFVNVRVQDLAGNQSQYTEGSQTYTTYTVP